MKKTILKKGLFFQCDGPKNPITIVIINWEPAIAP
jgi:hypothetical protein